MMCWDITYGLDVQDPNPQIWSEEIGEHSCHSTNDAGGVVLAFAEARQSWHDHGVIDLVCLGAWA